MELLKVDNLRKVFLRHKVEAVKRVSFSVLKGEVLGLVGESGCGKSTLGACILRLIDAQGGSVFYKGEDLFKAPYRKMRMLRRELQMIFQDPYTALDPRMSVGKSVEEVFIIHERVSSSQRRKKVIGLLEMVGLSESYFSRLPSHLSGGERQRVGIARSLATNPEFLICDEPVSSLDISVQAQILNLLMDLQRKKNLTYLFISHDPGVIGSICDRVLVMKDGEIVEEGECEDIFRNSRHEYTRNLLESTSLHFV